MTEPWKAYEKDWAFCQRSLNEGAPHKMPKTLLEEAIQEGIQVVQCKDLVRCEAFITSAREARADKYAAE